MERLDRAWPAGPRLAAGAAVVLAIAHFASFPFRAHPIATDNACYLYFAQRASHGAVPHRDLFEAKTQLATFAGAALHRVGEWLAVDPLYAIRLGYLMIAAAGAALAFEVHRRLARGRLLPALVGLATVLGFPLLGVIPAIGNMPKVLLAVLAAGAALAVERKAWAAAGGLAVLAFMDWQVGGLAMAAVATAAAMEPAGRRWRTVAAVAAGAGLGLAPFLVYFWQQDALGAFWRQTMAWPIAQSVESLAGRSLLEDWPRRWRAIEAGLFGQHWLLAAGAAGLLLYPAWLAGRSAAPPRQMAASLGVYHYGAVAFSAWDFQRYGDVYFLLNSMAFFSAVAINDLFLRLDGRLRTSQRPALASVPSLLAVAIVIAALQPWRSRGEFYLPERARVRAETGAAGPRLDYGLADQRGVARQLASRLGSKRVLFMGPAEQLFLMNLENPLPIVQWNHAALANFRRNRAEGSDATLERLIAEAQVQMIVCRRGCSLPAVTSGPFRFVATISSPSGYGIELYEAGTAR